MRTEGRTNAVSSNIGVVLMLVIAVVLAAAVGVTVFDLQDRLKQPGSVAGVTTDAGVADGYFAGGNYKVVLSHVAGDSLGSEDTELVVRTSGGVARVEFAGFDGEARRFRESSSKVESVTGPGNPPGDGVIYTFSGNSMPGEFGPGDSIEVVIRSGAVDKNEEVEIVLVDASDKKVASEHSIPGSEFPGS